MRRKILTKLAREQKNLEMIAGGQAPAADCDIVALTQSLSAFALAEMQFEKLDLHGSEEFEK